MASRGRVKSRYKSEEELKEFSPSSSPCPLLNDELASCYYDCLAVTSGCWSDDQEVHYWRPSDLLKD